jgi:alcohol dehydrogenase class IV
MFFLPFNEPIVYRGEHSISNIPSILKKNGISKIMIVTDANLVKIPYFAKILQEIQSNNIEYVMYDLTKPNPTISQIEDAFKLFVNTNSNGLLAIGGGSSIDLAKGIGVKLTHPNKKIQQMRGLLKVLKKLPLLIAIPSTAGTGSEATVACVVTDELTKEKYAINDPVLIPKYAILDPLITVGLPFSLTSTTGMDALTHAVEAYIGHSNTKKTKRMAISAIKTIFGNLEEACINPTNINARMNMLNASYEAGVAFTRAYVGNVHALAHQLGGVYHIPHGLANAILLPVVLRYYNHATDKKLSMLYDAVYKDNTLDTISAKSEGFIDKIFELNQRMNIPAKIKIDATDDDIFLMASRAFHEANPLYPVPTMFDILDFANIYNMIIEKNKSN